LCDRAGLRNIEANRAPEVRVSSTTWRALTLALSSVLTLLASMHTAPSARAQVGPTPPDGSLGDSSTGFQIEIFEPQPAQGVNLLNLVKTDVMQHLYPSFGVFLQYVDDPFELARQDDDDAVVSRLVGMQVRLEPWVAFGLFDRVDVGLVLPLVVAQDGESLAFLNRPGESIGGFAVGDLRLVPKVRIVDPHDAFGFGLSFAAPLYLPTGDESSFNSYGAVRFKPTLALDWREETYGFAVVANLGYMLQPRAYAHNLVLDDGLHWGLGLEIPIVGQDRVELLVSFHGIAALEDSRDPADLTRSLPDDLASPMELDLALQMRFDAIVVQLGGGLGLNNHVGAPDFRALLSVGYTPVTRDRDGDGILDRDDACPDDPEDKDGFEDQDGCPDLDNDKDGVLDVSDGAREPNGFGACRDDPEDKDGFEDADGCPDHDNDRDAVVDRDDGPQDHSGYGRCRDAPEDHDGFEDADGCPDDDNDKDGLADKVDGPPDATGFGSCRNDAEDKDGFADEDGCPDLDNDGDGVPDVVDGPKDASGFGACRDQPETRNGYADEDGCPDTAPKKVRVTQFQIEILDKVFFDYNKATIQPVSFGLLDEVALVIEQHPQLTRIRVEGHTDFHGDDAYNDKLSQARAEAVMAYLIARGVAAGRLEAKGWGEQDPLVPGAAGRTAQGRAKNRRVEFDIVEVHGKPHSPDKPVIIEKHEVEP